MDSIYRQSYVVVSKTYTCIPFSSDLDSGFTDVNVNMNTKSQMIREGNKLLSDSKIVRVQVDTIELESYSSSNMSKSMNSTRVIIRRSIVQLQHPGSLHRILQILLRSSVVCISAQRWSTAKRQIIIVFFSDSHQESDPPVSIRTRNLKSSLKADSM